MSTTARRFYGEYLFAFHVVDDPTETEFGISITSTWSFWKIMRGGGKDGRNIICTRASSVCTW
jgi:hypothetical protein